MPRKKKTLKNTNRTNDYGIYFGIIRLYYTAQGTFIITST